MLKKIDVYENKTLKLTNVLCKDMIQAQSMGFEKSIQMLKAYAMSNMAQTRGPLISYTKPEDESDQIAKVDIMFQLEQEIPTSASYSFKKEVFVPNCLMGRFCGKEEDIHFVYKKLVVHAFENDIDLIGDNYTVFVEKKESGYITADVFMPIR